MTLTGIEKIALGLVGVTALGIGGSILAAPHRFYSGYGISLGTQVNLLSELRAPAACLAVLGGLMLVGIVRQAWSGTAMVAALTVFLAFPAGRLVGIAVDGLPSGSILAALAIELAIAALCLTAFRRRVWLSDTAGDAEPPTSA